MHTMAHAPEEIAMLMPFEAQQITQEVHHSRPYWKQRHATAPFFTLGVASYLDGGAGKGKAYTEGVAQLNPLLRERFGLLYDRLSDVLTEALKCPVFYDERFSLPGFHIYLGDEVFTRPVAKIHCDLQYRNLDWSGVPGVDFTDPLSFTLPVSLPQSGGGLNYWNLGRTDADTLPREEFAQRFREQPPEYFPYTEGRLVLHSGQMIHQASLMSDLQPGDERITLQGHGVRVDGRWLLYW